MNIKPSNQQFAKIFDAVAPRYNEVSNRYLVYRRKTILGDWAQGKCLEVGAGTGEISIHLSQNHEVVATDIAPGMVEEIKKHGIDPVRSRARPVRESEQDSNTNTDSRLGTSTLSNGTSPKDRGAAISNGVEAHVCDAEKLPFQDASFDTVLAAEVLFYLDNPDNFLSEAYRVLKPQGRLLISCASNFPVKFYDQARSWLRAMGVKKSMYFDEDTLREFMTSSKLKTMLSRHNFKVVEEKRAPIVPIAAFDHLNNFLEKTPLKNFGIFIFTHAQKINN